MGRACKVDSGAEFDKGRVCNGSRLCWTEIVMRRDVP